MFPLAKSNKAEPLLYDVRLHGTEHDVVLLKGSPDEASSVLLSGTVVLSVREPIQIKNLSLKMTGKIRLNVPVQYQGPRGPAQRHVRYERTFYEHTWDNLNINSYFENLYDNYGKRATINSKSSGNLADLHRRSKSSTSSLISLAGLGSSSGSHNHHHHHTLLQGNYEFPFSAILPGSLVESVEGLPNASITYKLEANIERNKFYSDLICKKHIRVVRTLSTDAVELSETMAVDNTWPNKVDYSISVPAKAIAIGSLTPIHIEVVPLMKGLRLGPIKVTMIENSQYCGSFGNVATQERTVCKTKLKDPLGHVNRGPRDPEEEELTFQDRWQVDTFLQVPTSLSRCTQDCTLLNSIKVRHKLKFVISLINSDGHVSELRASLPAQLFISPFVALTVRNPLRPEYENGNGSSSSSRRTSLGDEEGDEDVIFAKTASELELANLINNWQVPSSVPDLMSPPNYESHIYDRLWNDVSVPDTPHGSGTQTPIEGQSIGQVLDSQQNVDELEDNLMRLHLQRQEGRNRSASTSNVIPGNPAKNPQETTIEGASNGNANAAVVPAATSPAQQALPMSRSGSAPLVDQQPGIRGLPPAPLVTSGASVQHLSRSSSSILQIPQSPNKEVTLDNLSSVPSYEKAIKSESAGNDLPPVYPADENPSHDRKHHLERPQVVHHRSSSSLLSKKSNSSIPSPQPSQAALVRRGSSSSSSGIPPPLQPHADSPSNGPAHNGKNQTVNKHFSFGMTPVGSSSSTGSFPLKRSLSKGSLHERSSSLNNLRSLLKNHKK
ncbi:ZYRO0G00924p [Zygosaccharomyces rouxii]|uniref:ZYRO0G00924p n=1 Tax=Zygosaccharomyces rouxii (strain ATCC 2623 / CBS 732 / NBRC 1130 / NCYC 568 / NRRL Y-229) TaxID=559307 RepID=C5E1S1_ZYGRC|nr:uncharacterized protein ZYRO0G00924g [Zygosaccharomyces rouxii]KAH9202112.1 hypothetical protein LQ764DRAFT_97 [Zygosaccharomyces rouxii]CAR29114.1 ZYRO0G00924p [Zygosaccharomyces rouxii]